MAVILVVVAAATFTPTSGGESRNAFEAASLQSFISTALLVCTAVGYGFAIAVVVPQHAHLRLPFILGVVAGSVTFTVAAVGTVDRFARVAGLSSFLALAVLGYFVGLASSALVVLAARVCPKERRA